MATELPELILADADTWRGWLAEHHDSPAGVWLVLAKKVPYRIGSAKRADTRARRIEQFVAMLARGETVYPQQKTLG